MFYSSVSLPEGSGCKFIEWLILLDIVVDTTVSTYNCSYDMK